MREHMDSASTVQAGGMKLSGIVKSPFSTSETPTSFKDITNYNNYYEFSTESMSPMALSKNFRRARGPSRWKAWSRNPRSWTSTPS